MNAVMMAEKMKSATSLPLKPLFQPPLPPPSESHASAAAQPQSKPPRGPAVWVRDDTCRQTSAGRAEHRDVLHVESLPPLTLTLLLPATSPGPEGSQLGVKLLQVVPSLASQEWKLPRMLPQSPAPPRIGGEASPSVTHPSRPQVRGVDRE